MPTTPAQATALAALIALVASCARQATPDSRVSAPPLASTVTASFADSATAEASGPPIASPTEIGTCDETTVTRGMPVQVLLRRGELYIVSDDGSLISFDSKHASYRRHLTNQRVVAITRTRSAGLWALSTEKQGRAEVWSSDGGVWGLAFDVPLLRDDRVVALGERLGQPVVVLSAAAVTFEGGTARRAPFARKLPSTLQPECAVTESGFLHVGINAGEFGGGLLRIALATGAAESIQRRDGTGLCDGPLNSSCDPVTAVIVDPRTPDCVWASVGLAHMGFTHGRVLHVCNGRVEVDFEEAVTATIAGRPMPMTAPILGLAPTVDGYLASSPSALYTVRGGVPEPASWKAPVERCGFHVAEQVPGVDAVFTSINNRLSVSGPMPLIAAEAP